MPINKEDLIDSFNVCILLLAAFAAENILTYLDISAFSPAELSIESEKSYVSADVHSSQISTPQQGLKQTR